MVSKELPVELRVALVLLSAPKHPLLVHRTASRPPALQVSKVPVHPDVLIIQLKVVG